MSFEGPQQDRYPEEEERGYGDLERVSVMTDEEKKIFAEERGISLKALEKLIELGRQRKEEN